MISVSRISAVQTRVVRQPVLRPGLPVSSCVFDGDSLLTTVHFGVFLDQNLVGVVTLLANNHPYFPGKQLQLRGMAVLNHCQGLGLGKKLLEACEQYAHENHYPLIWCNARTSAKNFYARFGYLIQGDEFVIEGVGPHYVMYKTGL